MTHSLPLKAALKRGALVAAANWPLVFVQFIAEATLKLLLAVPTIGGVFLVMLLLQADVEDVLGGSLRDIAGTVFTALRANPIALVAFALAFLIVLFAGSALTFVVKGGTVSLLASAEAAAGTIERPPLRLDALRRLDRVHIDPFLDACKHFWRRYVRLGGCLLIAYTVTAVVYLAIIVGGYALADGTPILLGWTRGCGVGIQRPRRLDHAHQPVLFADSDDRCRRGRQRADRGAAAAAVHARRAS